MTTQTGSDLDPLSVGVLFSISYFIMIDSLGTMTSVSHNAGTCILLHFYEMLQAINNYIVAYYEQIIRKANL